MSNYFVYITTNPGKEVLYIGVTNDLHTRLLQHFENRGNPASFAGRYFCYKLIYFERHFTAEAAIEREKQLKKWNRKKKEALVAKDNPHWKFLNPEVMFG
ncbi:GIY-YIG nuclease family protein [Fulvivirga sp. RKSG066]|nr:GIY-YIG nuclease family protein [Fulvivirga aurantia]MTI19578.1 GIY-YIG nuclease family protein [Fulvivirga aurantia]